MRDGTGCSSIHLHSWLCFSPITDFVNHTEGETDHFGFFRPFPREEKQNSRAACRRRHWAAIAVIKTHFMSKLLGNQRRNWWSESAGRCLVTWTVRMPEHKGKIECSQTREKGRAACYWSRRRRLWHVRDKSGVMNECRCCLFVINSLIIGQINEMADEIWAQTRQEKLLSPRKRPIWTSVMNTNFSRQLALQRSNQQRLKERWT